MGVVVAGVCGGVEAKKDARSFGKTHAPAPLPRRGQGKSPPARRAQNSSHAHLTTHARPTHTPSYRLNLWDVGGQRTLRPFWRNHYEATDALVWVVDSADPGRWGGAAAELGAVLAEERLAGAALLVLANKQDVAGAAPPAEVAAALGLPGLRGGGGEGAGCADDASAPSLTRGRAWAVFGTAAAAGAVAGGLAPAFEWLVAALDAQRGGGGGVAVGGGGGGVGAAAAAPVAAATAVPAA
jgi:hypothetical protein